MQTPKATDLTSQSSSSSRRQFLKQTGGLALAVAAFPSIVPASALGKDGTVAPSNRIAVGCIGVGPQGQGDMGNFLNQKDAQVIAVCDVKTEQLEQARAAVNRRYQNNDCATFRDFQELIGRKDIDACLIATPDHWHVLTAVAAVRAGKDIYVEKPMGLSLGEDWALRKEVHRHKRVFQFGTQQRSSRIFRLACQLVRNGRIGTLKHINVWAPGSAPGGSTKVVPVPSGIDYERWLGRLPSNRTRRISVRLTGRGRPGGLGRPTLWALSRAGGFIRSTSPPGGRTCSAVPSKWQGGGLFIVKGLATRPPFGILTSSSPAA
ncbi:MAG TPA: Gfo/Idh/MocA family oxidoreductase [Bacillota bacterium]|nr:Gfo/Idh/MocA family oxidoreductase [Bacillota bacterium]